jgi:hypothetical protein
VAAKDLNPKTEPDEKTSAHFRMQHLDDFLYSWGAAAADVNHDGIPDVIAGPSISLVRSTPSTASSRRRAATGQQHSPKA